MSINSCSAWQAINHRRKPAKQPPVIGISFVCTLICDGHWSIGPAAARHLISRLYAASRVCLCVCVCVCSPVQPWYCTPRCLWHEVSKDRRVRRPAGGWPSPPYHQQTPPDDLRTSPGSGSALCRGPLAPTRPITDDVLHSHLHDQSQTSYTLTHTTNHRRATLSPTHDQSQTHYTLTYTHTRPITDELHSHPHMTNHRRATLTPTPTHDQSQTSYTLTYTTNHRRNTLSPTPTHDQSQTSYTLTHTTNHRRATLSPTRPITDELHSHPHGHSQVFDPITDVLHSHLHPHTTNHRRATLSPTRPFTSHWSINHRRATATLTICFNVQIILGQLFHIQSRQRIK